jgi:hypothetical protein
MKNVCFFLVAGHQQYHHNEENMSKACLQNYNHKYEVAFERVGYKLKTTPHAISSYAIYPLILSD